MNNREDVYSRLRREINKMPIPYSETKSGVELRILRHLFTATEAELAIHLNILPETLDRIYRRVKKAGIDISRKDLENTLDGLVQKGAIMGGRLFEAKGKGKQYSLAQLAIGMFEFQVDQLTPAFVKDFEQYIQEQFHRDILSSRPPQMRTIPVSRAVTADLRIESYNDIRAYVRGLSDEISVSNCVCRQSNEIIGNKCRHSDIRETCLQFHDVARFIIDKGPGRSISKDEALAILDRAEKAGFILQPENAREPQFICCCCIDCCHALKITKMHPRPADLYVSDFYATIDASKCKGCKKCVALCGMEAISMNDSVAIVNRDRCIGCGVCIAACPNDAHRLVRKDKSHRPPKTHDAMYQKIMMDRVGFAGALKAVTRVLTGRKA